LPTLGLIFANFGDYALTRILVFALGTVVGLLALSFNVLPVIGTLVGWMLLAGGRFTGRLLWAYSLAQMDRPNQRVPAVRLTPSPIGNWQ